MIPLRVFQYFINAIMASNEHFSGSSSSTRSSSPISSEDTDMIAYMTGGLESAMRQARAKVYASLAHKSHAKISPQVLKVIEENDELDKRLDRCIALSETLLADAKAQLKEPAELPELLTLPVQKTETLRLTPTIIKATEAAEAAQVSAQKTYSTVMAMLEVQLASQVPLPRSKGL